MSNPYAEQLNRALDHIAAIERKVAVAEQERDELRALRDVLRSALVDCAETLDSSGHSPETVQRCLDLVGLGKEDAARYVQGLEDALHALTKNPQAGEKWFNEFTYGCEYCDAIQRTTSEGFTHEFDCLMAKARQALAAKEKHRDPVR